LATLRVARLASGIGAGAHRPSETVIATGAKPPSGARASGAASPAGGRPRHHPKKNTTAPVGSGSRSAGPSGWSERRGAPAVCGARPSRSRRANGGARCPGHHRSPLARCLRHPPTRTPLVTMHVAHDTPPAARRFFSGPAARQRAARASARSARARKRDATPKVLAGSRQHDDFDHHRSKMLTLAPALMLGRGYGGWRPH
jgi:hypothetical protein